MANWMRVGSFDSFVEGEPVHIHFDYESAVLYRVGDTIYAIQDVCTHDGGPLGDGELDGCQVICPRHGARFDIRSGAALTMPAVEDVPTYATKIEAGVVYIDPPNEAW